MSLYEHAKNVLLFQHLHFLSVVCEWCMFFVCRCIWGGIGRSWEEIGREREQEEEEWETKI